MTMHTPPNPRPQGMNLGQQGMTIGQLQRPQQRQQAQAITPAQYQPLPSTARSYGIAEALSNPIDVQSGSVAEALAEMLASGLHGRAARNEREREETEQNEARQRSFNERGAYSEALAQLLDPTLAQQPNAAARVASTLGRANPEAGFSYYQSQQPSAEDRRLESIIASLPPDQQALARMNPEGYVNGMMRHRFPAPQRPSANGYGGATDEEGWTYE
jgi:hypothetical protein